MTLYPTCQGCKKAIKGAAKSGMHWQCFAKAVKRLDRKAKTAARKSESALAGRSFQSELERLRADELVLMEKAGIIRNLKFQEVVYLTRSQIRFKTDASYEIAYGEREYEEVKGQEFERWLIVKQLWPEYGPGKLTIFKADRNGKPTPVKTIIPTRIHE